MGLGLSYPIKIAYLNGNCVKSGFEEDKLVFTNNFDDKVILTNSESAN